MVVWSQKCGKVKQTILYLKSEGYRIDGLGWQAHLRSDMNLAMDEKQLKYFSSLIDWAHDNDLDFHVTEIDYKIMSNSKNSKSFLDQAAAYANILKVLLEKSNNGVVTFNTWGMVDGKKGNIMIKTDLFSTGIFNQNQHITESKMHC